MKWFRLNLVLALCILATLSKANTLYVKDTNVCVNAPVIIKDTHTPPTGRTVIARYWDFDGVNKDTTTEDSVMRTYPASDAGRQFTVRLTVKYDDASTFDQTVILYIRSLPIIDTFYANRQITCPWRPIIFETKSSTGLIAGGALRYWRVEFGDMNAVNISSTPATLPAYFYATQGVFNAKYIVTDDNNCVATSSIEMRIIKTPEVKFEPIQLRCRDSLVTYENRTLGRDTNWIWEWTFIDTLFLKDTAGKDSFANTNTKNVNGNYLVENYTHTHPFYGSHNYVYLIGQNQYGCIAYSDTMQIKVDTTPRLVITPSIDTTICFGESVQYTIRGSDTLWYSNFDWGNKIKGDSIVLFTPQTAVQYTVYGKTPQCPPTSKTIKITVVKPVETKVHTEPDNILKGSISKVWLQSNGILDSLKWSPDSSLSDATSDTTFASPIIATTYKVRLWYSLNNYKCWQDDSARITVDNKCNIDSLKIPTAFTPNGDSKNEEFYIKSFALKTILTFNVYNRWGNKVFYIENVPADDPAYGWNGKVNNNGDELPPGVYIYNISAICKNNEVLNFQGEVTILK